MNQISLHIVPRWLTQFVLLRLSSTPGPQSFYFLRYSSPLPQSIKSCIWLYQRWTPSLYRHRPATFHHLKITWMTRELSSQAFLQKGYFRNTLTVSYCPHVLLFSLSFLYLVLVFIDYVLWGGICHLGLMWHLLQWNPESGLNAMETLRKKLFWPNPVLVGFTM